MSVSAFGSVAPRDPRRPERGRKMERRHGFRVLCPSRLDDQQPPGRPRDQHARAAPDSELHGLHQHVDDSETTGAAALARDADSPRLRGSEPADLGTCESVWPIRSRHEYAIGVAVIEMAPGDRTVGSTPCSTVAAAHGFGSLRQSRSDSVRGATKLIDFTSVPTGNMPSMKISQVVFFGITLLLLST